MIFPAMGTSISEGISQRPIMFDRQFLGFSGLTVSNCLASLLVKSSIFPSYFPANQRGRPFQKLFFWKLRHQYFWRKFNIYSTVIFLLYFLGVVYNSKRSRLSSPSAGSDAQIPGGHIKRPIRILDFAVKIGFRLCFGPIWLFITFHKS